MSRRSMPSTLHGAAGRVVRARQQLGDARLPGAGVADQCGDGAGGDGERHVVEHRAVDLRVAERDVVERRRRRAARGTRPRRDGSPGGSAPRTARGAVPTRPAPRAARCRTGRSGAAARSPSATRRYTDSAVPMVSVPSRVSVPVRHSTSAWVIVATKISSWVPTAWMRQRVPLRAAALPARVDELLGLDVGGAEVADLVARRRSPPRTSRSRCRARGGPSPTPGCRSGAAPPRSARPA